MVGKGPRFWKNENTMDIWRRFQLNYGSAKSLEELVRLSRAHSPAPGDSDYARRTKAKRLSK